MANNGSDEKDKTLCILDEIKEFKDTLDEIDKDIEEINRMGMIIDE